MPNLARKAADLIRETSGRWLNLDPRRPVEIGQYGKIDSDGRFISHGNIYNNEEVRDIVPNVDQFPAQLGKTVEEEKLKSEYASQWSFDFDPNISVTDVLKGTIRLQFEVASGRRAAYLIAKMSRTDYMPTDQLLAGLVHVKNLAGMYLVIERTICHGYSFGVTTKGSSKVDVKVDANIPVLAAGPVDIGGGAGIAFQGNSHVQWSTVGNDDDYTYVTTLTMLQMHPLWINWLLGLNPFRGPMPKIKDDQIWIPAKPRWAPLDEDGDEELPVDDVPEDEDVKEPAFGPVQG